MKYEVSKLKPFIENSEWKVYTLGHITDDKTKGVVVYNESQEQYEAVVDIKRKYVVELLQRVK